MLGIQQPIEGFAVPVDLDAQAGTERLQNAFDRSNWHAIALAAFDAADGRLRGPGGSGEISLTPTAPSTQTSNGASNPHEIHRRSLENSMHRRLARRRPRDQCTATRGHFRHFAIW